MSVAARTMGWQRRMRGTPGPLAAPSSSGSGESPTGLLTVELYLGGWVDITALGLVRYQSGIKISHGQSDETSSVTTASCSMVLDNRDGRFSPRNPLGPYYGSIGRNTPIRVSVQSGLDKSYRFAGEVPSWPVTWDPTGTDVNVPIQAAGILRRLGQGSTPLRSPVFLLFSYNAGTALAPLTYWPCEDSSTATSIASGIGGRPMAISGSPTLASSSTILSSDALPILAGAKFTGTVPTYSPDPVLGTSAIMMVTFPAAGEAASVICQITTGGTIPTWELYYATASNGNIGLRGRSGAGAVVLDTAAVFTNLSSVNGGQFVISAQLSSTAGEVDANLWIQDLVNPANGGLWSLGLGGSQSIGRFTSVVINPAGTLQETAVGHIAVSTAGFGGAFASAYTGYQLESAAQRFARLCDLAGIPVQTVSTAAPGVVPTIMGAQHSGTLLQLLQECVDADQGLMYELTDQLGLGFRTHNALANQDPVLTLDYAQNHLSDIPQPVDDDAFTRNDVTVARLGGSSARAQQLTGVLNVNNPPQGVGRYDTSDTVNISSDNDLADQAGWQVHLGTTDEPRYPHITVQLSRAPFQASPALRRQVLALTPGDRFTIVNPPSWLPPGDISQLALGWAETIDQFLHEVTLNCEPESPWRVAITDDPVFGHADTDGSTLTAAVDAVTTVLPVATTNPSSPLWTTNPSDLPFDLLVSGERVTCTTVGTQLSANPFLTVDASGWTGTGGAAVSWSTAHVHPYNAGGHSLQIVPDGVTASGGANGTLTGVGTVTAAATYVASAWAYCASGWSDLRMCVDWYDASGVFLSSGLGSATVVAAGVWTMLQQTLTAPASASQGVLRARHGATAGPANTWSVWAMRLVPTSSNATSPQTLTVTRSVNGVVKPLPANADVRLYQPAIISR